MTNLLQIVSKLNQFSPDYNWTVPTDLSHGLLTSNIAFRLAKTERKNPTILAQELCQNTLQPFAKEHNLPILITTVGAYINIQLDQGGLASCLNQAQEGYRSFEQFFLKTSNSLEVVNASFKQLDFYKYFGIKPVDKLVMLEYVGVNVAKPMHAGHMRNANLGEALRRILLTKYSNLITDHHWGDWGVQFGIVIWAWKILEQKQTLTVDINGQLETINLADYEKDPIDLLVKLYVWGNQQKEIVDNWDDLIRSEFTKLENGDDKNRQLWADFVAHSKLELNRDLQLLNVPAHNLHQGESYYETHMIELAEFMEANSLWQTEGKGRFIDLADLLEKWLDMPQLLKTKIKSFGRCYLKQSKDGYTTYPFRDVAARFDWAKNHQTELMITLTDFTQKHNFDQAFAIIAYLASLPEFKLKYGQKIVDRLSWQNLVHISYGYLSLPEGKMSTRKGNFLTARNLINSIVVAADQSLEQKTGLSDSHKAQKVAISALKWFDLNRDSISDVVLNIDQILAFEGNTGVYQLYTIARLNSILQKNQNILGANKIQPIEISKLNQDEILIINTMLQLPLILEQICQTYKPHILCTHLFELATLVNSWYGKYSVTNEIDPIRQQNLLLLCQNIATHIKLGLYLLGIEAVDSL